MPIIFEPNDLPVEEADKVKIETLANSAMLGGDALQVKRLSLEANATSPVYEAAEAERFLYVIRGRGQADVDRQTFPLEAESVLWLAKEDRFSIQAGLDGLEILFCQAPAGE